MEVPLRQCMQSQFGVFRFTGIWPYELWTQPASADKIVGNRRFFHHLHNIISFADFNSTIIIPSTIEIILIFKIRKRRAQAWKTARALLQGSILIFSQEPNFWVERTKSCWLMATNVERRVYPFYNIWTMSWRLPGEALVVRIIWIVGFEELMIDFLYFF